MLIILKILFSSLITSHLLTGGGKLFVFSNCEPLNSRPLCSPSISLPSLPPPYPSSLLLSSCRPLPVPFLLPLPSSPLMSLPLEVGPLNPAGGLGSAVSSPSGVWGGAPAEVHLVHFSLKTRQLMAATILMILLRINWPAVTINAIGPTNFLFISEISESAMNKM